MRSCSGKLEPLNPVERGGGGGGAARVLGDGALRDERLVASAGERLRAVGRGTTAERAAHRPSVRDRAERRAQLSSCALNHRPEHTRS